MKELGIILLMEKNTKMKITKENIEELTEGRKTDKSYQFRDRIDG